MFRHRRVARIIPYPYHHGCGVDGYGDGAAGLPAVSPVLSPRKNIAITEQNNTSSRR